MLPLAAGKHELGDTVKYRNNGRYISDDKISNAKHIFPARLSLFYILAAQHPTEPPLQLNNSALFSKANAHHNNIL